MHRRQSSQDEDENDVLQPMASAGLSVHNVDMPRSVSPSEPTVDLTHSPPHRGMPTTPLSAGPYRTGFGLPAGSHARQPHSPATNGFASPNAPSSASPYTRSFTLPTPNPPGHQRTRSTSTGFGQMASSPLNTTFPFGHARTPSRSPLTPSPLSPSTSSSGFDTRGSSSPNSPLLNPPMSGTTASPGGTPASPVHARHHSRLHSRNLSVFFPRPGALTQSAISEDGGQELEVHTNGGQAPVMSMPPAGSNVDFNPRQLGAGFTFGGRPVQPGSNAGDDAGGTASQRAARRGHHHKHSMSHQFFSFLEPGGPAPNDLHTTPAPVVVSPWTPTSPSSGAAHDHDHDHEHDHDHDHADPSSTHTHEPKHVFQRAPRARVEARGPSSLAWGFAALAQFALGAWVWVAGQQTGSLACTGLGYWVVFDAMGVALRRYLPAYLHKSARTSGARRMYGNGRIETVALFAQAVYLLFASVYVCKETVEHLLLSIGQEGKEGHHHHSGDEQISLTGIDFPVTLIFISLLSLVGTTLAFDTHAKLADTAGNRLPPPSTFFQLLKSLRFSTRSLSFGSSASRYPAPTLHSAHKSGWTFSALLSNPYSLAPVLFAATLLSINFFAASSHHLTFDLGLAFLVAAVTFQLAYPASVALGTVLLQTAPPRGSPDGKMEAFLRAMREIERHPQVLHLPAPHIWQFTPSSASPSATLPPRVRSVWS